MLLRCMFDTCRPQLQVTKGNLEQLRAIKNRMVRLFTRVETIKELLQRLLDDDSDLRDMNLSAKCALLCGCRMCWTTDEDLQYSSGLNRVW